MQAGFLDRIHRSSYKQHPGHSLICTNVNGMIIVSAEAQTFLSSEEPCALLTKIATFAPWFDIRR